MKIANINLDQEVCVIAEIGNNHEGDYVLAQEMIHSAAEAGVHAVKFQSITPEKLVAPSDEARITQLKKFQFSAEQFTELSQVANKAGVIFLSTPFDVEAVEYLNELVPAFKIASGDNNNVALLKAVAETGKPIIMSTGLAALEQVRQSKSVIETIWNKNGISQDVVLLHCVVSYPTPPEFAHLSAINDLKALSDVVGYSDHTIGVEAAVLSVALGARVIEKHFTIDKNHSDFRDHQLSADPEDMKNLVSGVKNAEILMGRGKKRIQDCEKGNIGVRRSIFANQDIQAGCSMVADDLICLRSIEGVSASELDTVLGKTLRNPIKKGTLLMSEMIKS